MKLKILSLIFIIMLISLPITHVMAMTIENDCQVQHTNDEYKSYIKNHVITGHQEHCAVVDTVRNDFDPKQECYNPSHNHKQVMKTIVVKEVYKIQYQCLDQDGDKWRVDVSGKVGKETGLYYNDETLWESAVPSPCITYESHYTYDLNKINDDDLAQLFHLMISVDQYLDRAKGVDVLIDLAAGLASGGTSIASSLITVAEYGGRIPYIGEVIVVAASAGFAIVTLYQFTDELCKIEDLKKQTVKVARENMLIPIVK